MKLRKGVLIVFEGIDGAGKTTQAKNLLNLLRTKGVETAFFREPTQGQWGCEIKKKAVLVDSLTPEEELELFQKDRKDNVKMNLKPALNEGKVIVLDRYYLSTIAYQGARGIDPDRIRRMNEEFAVPPDLVFILDIDAKKGLDRIQARKTKDLLFEQEEYLNRVRQIFKNIQGERIYHFDAQRPEQEISGAIKKIVLKYLAENHLA